MKSLRVTIQMKATEQYFPVVLFITLYIHGGSNFWVCGWNPKVCAFQVKATEQYFHAILFITLYKVVLTFKSIDGIPRCDH